MQMKNRFKDISLELEPLKKGHASKLFAVLKDPRIYSYIPEDPPTNEKLLTNRFDIFSQGAPKHLSELWLNYAIYNSEISHYIGTLQATIFENSRKASIAYLLNSDYWGKGYATKALLLMITKLIEEYVVIEFEAYIDTRNTRSIKLVKRLGFEYTRYEENADFFKGMPSHEYIFTMKSENFLREG